jgi:gliding motility-associated-like protein
MFTVVVSPREETLYKIEGYSGRCYGWAQHVVRTGIIPEAGGIALPMRVRRGEADIELVNRSHDEEGFYWVFPDSSRRFGDHYTYQIAPSWMGDTFPVYIVAYRGGCSDTAHIPIVLFNDEQWASNVFTPNEETNNRFFVPLLNKDDFHVEIFNRRGLKVYESDNPDEGWDGRSRGVLCPQATYVYRVRTSPKGSSEIKYVYGTVTLLR